MNSEPSNAMGERRRTCRAELKQHDKVLRLQPSTTTKTRRSQDQQDLKTARALLSY